MTACGVRQALAEGGTANRRLAELEQALRDLDAEVNATLLGGDASGKTPFEMDRLGRWRFKARGRGKEGRVCFVRFVLSEGDLCRRLTLIKMPKTQKKGRCLLRTSRL